MNSDSLKPGRTLTAAEQRAVDYGIDLSLLDENLRLTPWERMKRHDAAAALAENLRVAWMKKHEPAATVA